MLDGVARPVRLAFRWDGPSESLIAAAVPNVGNKQQQKKGWQVCFSKYACNYSNSVDIRIIPPQIRWPWRSLSLISASVVLFVFSSVFMSSHGGVEVTAG